MIDDAPQSPILPRGIEDAAFNLRRRKGDSLTCNLRFKRIGGDFERRSAIHRAEESFFAESSFFRRSLSSNDFNVSIV